MFLCGFVACGARAPAQHCWMCCANKRNIVGPRFDDREQEKMRGQRGRLRALAGICHVHESYFQTSGSLSSETSAHSLASLSGS